MPYWDVTTDSRTDIHGELIKDGDVLINAIPGLATMYWGELFFICRLDKTNNILEVRDYGNWNIGMCELGIRGNVINLGNYKKVVELSIISESDKLGLLKCFEEDD